MTSAINPLDLFNPRRLDLVVKWRLFRHFIGDKIPAAEQDYIWHIDQRAGAQLPLEVYLPKARRLFDSMYQNGFDPRYPIPINKSGMLLEGAHRTACSAALGIKAHIVQLDTDHHWPDWGQDWFKGHGMTVELPGILEDYRRLTNAIPNAQPA